MWSKVTMVGNLSKECIEYYKGIFKHNTTLYTLEQSITMVYQSETLVNYAIYMIVHVGFNDFFLKSW